VRTQRIGRGGVGPKATATGSGLQLVGGDVGDEVAEVVGELHLALPDPAVGDGRSGRQLDRLGEFGAEFGGVEAEAQVGGDGGEDVAAVERVRHRLPPEPRVGESPDACRPAEVAEHTGEQPVVGADQVLPADLGIEGVALGPDPRVHDRDVDRARREMRDDGAEVVAGVAEVLWTNLVRQVKDAGGRVDGEDHALQRGRVGGGVAVVGRQGDDGGA
jgi:hypothetical protein